MFTTSQLFFALSCLAFSKAGFLGGGYEESYGGGYGGGLELHGGYEGGHDDGGHADYYVSELSFYLPLNISGMITAVG
ncbi:unnamed protein product [Diabrotica balteata]|uniref:Glycine-rich protein n=1 Tax=Diabrotica balteata TaxID=107213 RepID=A0A9N9T8R0_DIABA|nr:unnamed protein product [Diabrotica balteata]